MRRHLSALRTLLPTLTSAAIAAGCAGSTDGTPSKSTGDLAASKNETTGTGQTPPATTPPTTPPNPPPPALAEVDVCDGADKLDLLAGVTRGAGPTDFLDLRQETFGFYPPRSTSLASTGTKCATATDKPGCEGALAAMNLTEGWVPHSIGMMPGPTHRYLVWNAGDAVGAVTSLETLRAFVAPVENAKDAALLATATDEYRIKCDGTKNAKQTESGWELTVESGHTCGAGAKHERHVLSVSTEGEVAIVSTTLIEAGNPGCAIGRRPEGLVLGDVAPCDDSVGAFFAEAACLEAASVEAFDRLAAELVALGAPAELVEAARASREDEVRHARMTAKMAKRFGAEPRPAMIEVGAVRTAFEIALENAVEGCVRETFGALVAHHQAAQASDRNIAAMMGVIAEDETRHAALAWDVAGWLEPQLSASERAEVNAAREAALAHLRSEIGVEPAAGLRVQAGMPDAARATHLLALLETQFIAPAIAA